MNIEKPYKAERFSATEVLHFLLLLLCILCVTLLVQQYVYHESANRYEDAASVISYSVQQSEIAESVSFEIANAPVNINTADLAELCRLSGIGEVKAQAIIDYRTENGLFTYPEEIMKVSGIGEGIYKKNAGQIILSEPTTVTE